MPDLRAVTRDSTLASHVRAVADRLAPAARTSIVGRTTSTLMGPLRRIVGSASDSDARSTLVEGSTLDRSVRRSTLWRMLEAARSRIGAAAARSTLRRTTETAGTYIRSSFGYRWLTAEPEPEVVVIDLRRTWSVGPPLAVLDRVVDAIVPGVEGATVVAAVERVGHSLRRRPVAIASALLLGAVGAAFARSILAADPSRRLLLVLLVVGAVAAVGLRSDATLSDLRETRTATLLVAALEPPEPPERVDRADPPGGASAGEDAGGDQAIGGEHADGPSEESDRSDADVDDKGDAEGVDATPSEDATEE